MKLEGRRVCGWEDICNGADKETEWEGVDWMHLAQDKGKWRAVVNTGIESYGCTKCAYGLPEVLVACSRRTSPLSQINRIWRRHLGPLMWIGGQCEEGLEQ